MVLTTDKKKYKVTSCTANFQNSSYNARFKNDSELSKIEQIKGKETRYATGLQS